MDNKISNIIGVPIPQWLIEQFNIRSKKGAGYGKRETSELQFLANKTAWVRLVSSVEVSSDDNRYFSRFLKDEPLTKFSVENGPYTFSTSVNSLAKNFVLFAGTSKYKKEENSFSHQLRSGISNGSYAMLGEEEVNRYGYTPMPGITSVTIDTMGRMGSVRSATINFKVFNKLQLDIIDALYFKLGYTMLLEWGHTYYYKTPPSAESGNPSIDPIIESTEELMIDPFDKKINKEKINYQISLNVKKSYGNYDGMLGVVTNFNFSRKEDGSYDCSLKIIGLGAIAESLKINRANVFTDVLKSEIKQLVETENTKIQNKINEEIEKYEKEVSVNKNDTTKNNEPLTIIEIYEKKIEEQNSTIVSGETPYKLSNYLYTPAFSATSLYDKSVADIVYDPNKTWAIRKFNVILEEGKNQISRITLSSNKLKRLLSSKEQFISATPDFKSYQIGGAIYGENYVQTLYGGLFRNEYDFYNIGYNVPVNDLVFTTDNSRYGQLDRYKGTFHRTISIAIKSVRQVSLFDLSLITAPIKEYLEKAKAAITGAVTETEIIERYFRETVYEALTSDDSSVLTYNNATFVLDKVELSDLSIETIKKLTDSTNHLDDKSKERYYPILLLTKTFKGVDFAILISDSGLIQDLQTNEPKENRLFFDKNQAIQDINDKKKAEAEARQAEIKKIEESNSKIEITKAQEEEINKFPSSLENALRVIQLYSYNRARNTESVQKIDFTTDYKIIKSIFQEVGLYSYVQDFKSKIIDGNIPDIPNYGNSEIIEISDQQLLEFYMKYGFNVSIMANVHTTSKDSINTLESIEPVNHKDLLCSYVIPYEVSEDFSQGLKLEKPVYIQLGTLLMLVNHLALIYDSKGQSSDNKTPIFYIDYNPNTNFCLSSLNHLSTNPFNFMIPYSGTKEDFQTLFDSAILTDSFKKDIFDPEEDNIYSESLPKFLTGGEKKDVYRGKLMNILVDIDYLLNTIKRYSQSDNTNSVYLKSFIDNILSDICKYLGNYNMLRLAYNDSANCFYIVDDQIIPTIQEEFAEKSTMKSSRYEIPLYGNTSIAKNLEIRTDISSRLSNMIAISANSERSQGEMSTDASSFGYINKNFRDRYIPLRTDIVTQNEKDEKKITDGDIDAAVKFNDAIIQYYGVINVNMSLVDQTTNYYISRMAKVKAENPASRASAIIPVSVNFTTDGISGFNMYQSFGINEELLPYTYTAQNYLDGDTDRVERRVGFCVIGLSHTIENNQWNTSVKSNMIFLKDSEDYVGDKAVYKRKREQGVIRNPKLPQEVSNSSGVSGGGGCQRRSVTTKNFRQLYPNAIPTIKSGNSNIPLSNLGLRPLSESEIIDDTSKNVFDCGEYKKIPPYFIIHHTAGGGSPQEVYNTFAARGFPAHYVIDKQGKIYRYLPDGLIGAHVGQANSIAMGVEIIAYNDKDVLTIQTNAAIRLAHYLGFNVDRVVGHGKVSDNKESTEGYSTVIRINPNYKPGYDRYSFSAYVPGKILPVSFQND